MATHEEDPRLTALEERYCHQARLLEELDNALLAQQRVIDRFSARLERLERQLVDEHEQPEQAPASERPPHY